MATKTSRSSAALTRAIGWYQVARGGRISPCRFYPSCSNYALEAIAVHGALRGSAMALRRISRCRPLGAHGIDLVPTKEKAEPQ